MFLRTSMSRPEPRATAPTTPSAHASSRDRTPTPREHLAIRGSVRNTFSTRLTASSTVSSRSSMYTVRLYVHVELHAADTVRGQVHAVAVDGLLHVLHVLAHFHDVQEQGLEAHVVRENGDVEQVRGHALGFLRQHAQVLGAGRRGHAERVFDRHAVGQRVAVGAERADALGQRRVLEEVALRRHAFHAAMDVPGGDLHLADRFAVDVEIGMQTGSSRATCTGPMGREKLLVWLIRAPPFPLPRRARRSLP